MRQDVYIEVSNLSFRINGRVILEELNFKAERGIVYGIFGANGSGKTTLFNLLCGIYKHTSGHIAFYGEAPKKHDPYYISTLGAGLARTFQVPAIVDSLSVLDNLLLSCRLSQEGFSTLFYRSARSRRLEVEARAEINQYLEQFGLASKAASPAGTLSYGERRLISNLGAVLTGAKVILLDEPFANVNVRHIVLFKKLLRSLAEDEQRTILLIEHLPDNLLGLTDVLLQLRERRIKSYEVQASSHEEITKIIHSSIVQYE